MEKDELVCGENCPHYNKINEVKKLEPSFDEIIDLADVFKLFADSTRLKIICSILNNELCVCDLCELLNLTQSNVSHQLQLLRTAKLVKYRKDGKQVYYSLQDEHVEKIIKMALEHIEEEKGGM
jgi:ArsR family transcriptional regulator